MGIIHSFGSRRIKLFLMTYKEEERGDRGREKEREEGKKGEKGIEKKRRRRGRKAVRCFLFYHPLLRLGAQPYVMELCLFGKPPLHVPRIKSPRRPINPVRLTIVYNHYDI